MTLHTRLNCGPVTIDRFPTGIAPGVWVWAGSVDDDPAALVIGTGNDTGLHQVMAALNQIPEKEKTA